MADTGRVLTGVPGLDEILGGGFIRGRSYLLLGTSGAGKTILSNQFLYNGATRYGDPGLYLAAEEPPRQLREDAARFGWDLASLESQKKLAIIDGSSAKVGVPSTERFVDTRPFDMESLIDQIITLEHEIGAKRAIIDSSTAIAYHLETRSQTRLALLKLIHTLKVLGVTTLVTCELEGTPSGALMENFLTDGVIVLYFRRILDTRIHSLEVYKMRGSQHSNKIHPFQITPQGITVNPSEGVYGEF